MAVHTLLAPLSPLQLSGGMQLKLEAIDPTTGAAVSGVDVADIAVFGRSLSDDADTLTASGPFMLVPGTPEVA